LELILYIFINILFYLIGYLVCKISTEEKINKYQKVTMMSGIKVAKIKMIIRTYRNGLYREETKLKSLAKTRQDLKSFDYMDVKSKLEVVRKIEEDIANEV